jgi:hypothetical protein
MVTFEVYEQDDYRVDETRATRFYTEIKGVAFKFMNERNKIAGRNIWRVGVCINNRICFDIDNPDMNNVICIAKYYGKLFNTDFIVIRTMNGYHVISKRKYENATNWMLDEAKILYPLLEMQNLQEYILAIRRWYRQQTKRERANKDKKAFLSMISEEFKQSGLYFGHGDFDIMFHINVMFRKTHCIRISKKCKEDNPEEIYGIRSILL